MNGGEHCSHRTFYITRAAREVLLLVTGASKAPMIYKVFEGDALTPLPVQIVNDRTQPTTWLLDEAAAAQVLAG
jgi:6-phosphogluconolactonase/glucosamine-6-phosphate isomerase/deaminase